MYTMYQPAWSKYTVPRRGALVPLQQSLADLLTAELVFLERQRRNVLAAKMDEERRRLNPSALPLVPQPLTEDEDSDETDTEYTLPRGQPVAYPRAQYVLRSRPPRAPLADLTPIPEVVSGAHLDSLGFERIHLDDLPTIFVDLEDRVAGIRIASPCQSARWENTINNASNAMRIASAHLDRAKLPGDSIRSGIAYDDELHASVRPRRIDRMHTLGNMVVLASLRYSPAIQDITSFQNAMFRDVAPRAWSDHREVIDEVVLNDCQLHLPMHLTDQGPYQPTAFSEIEYRFSTPDSSPRRDTKDHSASFRAITAVGSYHSTQGELILWTHRKIVTFTAGITFLLPASLVRYSFTEVEKPGWQMLITQSCSAGLHGFVADNFDSRSRQSGMSSRKERGEQASAGVALYSTVYEYDALGN
ncbi:hypothetical protein C8R47DRAFT_1219816 [Mycena vitilis]|nr:hypothetical protein C8R47DRAFT_1219816 [Mycena vitilis]